MGEVIDLQSKKPHMEGQAMCLNCRHTWQAVSPIGVNTFECIKCGTMKGVYRNLAQPSEGVVWQCQCGNDLFLITGNGCFCCICGTTQSFGQ